MCCVSSVKEDIERICANRMIYFVNEIPRDQVISVMYLISHESPFVAQHFLCASGWGSYRLILCREVIGGSKPGGGGAPAVQFPSFSCSF